jgi:hypothetical protein
MNLSDDQATTLLNASSVAFSLTHCLEEDEKPLDILVELNLVLSDVCEMILASGMKRSETEHSLNVIPVPPAPTIYTLPGKN